MLFDTDNVCVSSCHELYHSVFYRFWFLKRPDFRAIPKLIMDIFLQILDGNWLEDT